MRKRSTAIPNHSRHPLILDQQTDRGYQISPDMQSKRILTVKCLRQLPWKFILLTTSKSQLNTVNQFNFRGGHLGPQCQKIAQQNLE